MSYKFDPSVIVVILLAGTVFFFLAKFRLTQAQVHREMQYVTRFPDEIESWTVALY